MHQEIGEGELIIVVLAVRPSELSSGFRRCADELLVSNCRLPLFPPPPFGQINLARWISIWWWFDFS
jgi:hypothetical protein